jgi:hypothetical protein
VTSRDCALPLAAVLCKHVIGCIKVNKTMTPEFHRLFAIGVLPSLPNPTTALSHNCQTSQVAINLLCLSLQSCSSHLNNPPHHSKFSSEDKMTRGEVCLHFACAESTSAFVQPLCVPASQCGLEANDTPADIDPPSPYRAGWYPAWEQCLGAVSLLKRHRLRFRD